MKNKIKVIDFFEFKDGKTVLFIELKEGYFNIEDIFAYNDLKFKIKGIGMENSPTNENKSVLVELMGGANSASDLKDREFIKQEKS